MHELFGYLLLVAVIVNINNKCVCAYVRVCVLLLPDDVHLYSRLVTQPVMNFLRGISAIEFL